MGSALIVRTIALRSIFLMAVALSPGAWARSRLAAYQIGVGVWTFLAFAYDGIETGQALVARGAGRGSRHCERARRDSGYWCGRSPPRQCWARSRCWATV
ncbi:MAG: hypothetical protein R2704_17665 [Microthrixaceae bacterium]